MWTALSATHNQNPQASTHVHSCAYDHTSHSSGATTAMKHNGNTIPATAPAPGNSTASSVHTHLAGNRPSATAAGLLTPLRQEQQPPRTQYPHHTHTKITCSARTVELRKGCATSWRLLGTQAGHHMVLAIPPNASWRTYCCRCRCRLWARTRLHSTSPASCGRKGLTKYSNKSTSVTRGIVAPARKRQPRSGVQIAVKRLTRRRDNTMPTPAKKTAATRCQHHGHGHHNSIQYPTQ